MRRKRQRAHYLRRKAKILAYLGGCCEDCGKREPEVFLECDHVTPARKRFDPLRRWSMRWSKLVKELDLCVARCHRCHRDRTNHWLRNKWRPLEAVPF